MGNCKLERKSSLESEWNKWLHKQVILLQGFIYTLALILFSEIYIKHWLDNQFTWKRFSYICAHACTYTQIKLVNFVQSTLNFWKYLHRKENRIPNIQLWFKCHFLLFPETMKTLAYGCNNQAILWDTFLKTVLSLILLLWPYACHWIP